MAFFIILIIFLIVWLLWPWIYRQIQRYMARKAEDMIRKMTGMPPRNEEKRHRSANTGRDDSKRNRRGDRRYRAYSKSPEETHRIMREYAVDVEYTEIREFSDSIVFEQDKSQTRIKLEEQISDADYEIVRE